MSDKVEFHYRVVLTGGKEIWIWGEDAFDAGIKALEVEPDNTTIFFIGECEHECPDLEEDNEGII